MAFTLQRPVLIGGLGITIAGWAWHSLSPGMADLGGSMLWGAIALGSGVWWLSRSTSQTSEQPVANAPVDQTRVQKSLDWVETLIHQLETEQATATGNESYQAISLRDALADLRQNMHRTQLNLAITGGKGVGKTSLSRLLPIVLGKGVGKGVGEAAPEAIANLPKSPDASCLELPTKDTPQANSESADLVLFVTTGDLTTPEFQSLQSLTQQGQRVLLVFNKQDHYLPAERAMVLHQLQSRVADLIPAEDVLAIATNPAPIKVRRHQADGTVEEFTQQPEPDLASLQQRLATLLKQDGRQLILNAIHRQSLALKARVLAELNQLRRDRALPMIEQSQWIAGGAAFANPVPSLDLLATAAINAQLVMDLSAVYQQPLSLDQAKVVATTLAGQMVKLGLVEMTSQAVSALLKSHALTYVAGGLIQGISAAYLTRLAGLTLVEYFQTQSQVDRSAEQPFSVERLGQVVQSVFQGNQRTEFLRSLVSQGINRLTAQQA
jgi:uncharacterized protein (DUF697 family)